ncbi:MAG: hypothetical protein RBJ76_23700 [Stenomitos frigidus ULC029]
MFVLNPLIDTRLPQGFTQTGFDRIQPGMTKTEVLQLVPLPEHKKLEATAWGYGSDGACVFWDFAWFQLMIQFDQNGRVIKKNANRFLRLGCIAQR